MINRRQIEITQMKDDIINATVDLIIADGYDNISMRKIAKQIGYSPTTLYLYFKDKAEIISAITQKLFNFATTSALAKFNDIKDQKDQSVEVVLLTVLTHTVTSICEEPNLGIALIKSGENRLFVVDNDWSPMSAAVLIKNILDYGVTVGVIRKSDMQTANFLLISVIGFTQYCLENKIYQSEFFEEQVNSFIKNLIYGIVTSEYMEK